MCVDVLGCEEVILIAQPAIVISLVYESGSPNENENHLNPSHLNG